MKSTAVVPQAIAALKDGADHQLLRTAASVLRGVAEDSQSAANEALLGALARLTEQQADTSRDPRVAIIERLGETLGPARINDLIPYMIDYDDAVIAAARKAFESVVGVEPTQYYQRRRRYPHQPTEDMLNRLAREATIHLETGDVVMKLLPDVAPVTVARFMALIDEGFYKERTFHRIVPNFVVQGGSPGANEYAGTSRYMRDEVGPQGVHIRGAVGISTRGADTGDGQIFIDLVDVPRLDRDYTVFAYVTQGMELVDRLLEGAKIRNISFK
jgi:cyclophilin family peptidyl-prolyl cis-trans isomerase